MRDDQDNILESPNEMLRDLISRSLVWDPIPQENFGDEYRDARGRPNGKD
jgi:hypothetical protein